MSSKSQLEKSVSHAQVQCAGTRRSISSFVLYGILLFWKKKRLFLVRKRYVPGTYWLFPCKPRVQRYSYDNRVSSHLPLSVIGSTPETRRKVLPPISSLFLYFIYYFATIKIRHAWSTVYFLIITGNF